MANIDAAPKQGGSNLISVGVAALAVALFIGWLVMQRPAETVAVAEPGRTPTATPDEGALTVVTPDELNTTARVRELHGQDIRIDDIEVVSALGPQLFWLQLPGGAPFLAKLDGALIAAGMQPPMSGHYRIVGRLLEKNDATLTEWEQAGVLRNNDDRQQAEYGSAYIEARRVDPVGS